MPPTATRLCLVLATGVVSVLATGGCGSSSDSTARDKSLARIEAQNRADQARLAQRTRRVERELARRAQASRRSAQRSSESEGTSVSQPAIKQMPIPFPAKRKEEMVAYAQRHYGLGTYRLEDPKVIVEHYTASADAQSAYNTFAADVADSELHELPGTCAHFVIDHDGTIYQLVPLDIMCRHTVGLNYTSIGIEHAGFSDQDILNNPAELRASLALTRWLRCRFNVQIKDVIGHNESLSSPYHRENVARLRTQTHGDWTKADMDIYRARLQRLPC